MPVRTKVVSQLSLAILAAFTAAAWAHEDPGVTRDPVSEAADPKTVKTTVRRPDWVRSEVAAGPPTPGKLLRSSRGSKTVGTPQRTRSIDGPAPPTASQRESRSLTSVLADTTSDLVGKLAQDGSSNGVFARRFDATGAALGGEFAVNTHTTSSQRNPDVATDKKGNFVVAWESRYQDGDSYGVFAHRFDPTGAPVGGEFQVNTYTTSSQASPAIATDKKGNVVVGWQSYGQDGSDLGIFARRFDPTGVPLGGEFQVNTYTTSSQYEPAVVADKKGNLVVVWSSDGQDGGSSGVLARRFDPSGAALGGEFQVNTFTTSFQISPVVATDKKGNIVVAWSSYTQDGDSFGVFARRFNAGGVPLGGEFAVNSYTTSAQLAHSVATDKKGNLVVAWSGFLQDGDSIGVFARRFDPTGVPLGGEFQVNTYTTGSQDNPAVATDKKGNIFVTWAGA